MLLEIRRGSLITVDPRDSTVKDMMLDFHYSYLDGSNGGTAVSGLLCHLSKRKIFNEISQFTKIKNYKLYYGPHKKETPDEK